MAKKLIFLFILFGIAATAQVPNENLLIDNKVFPKENISLVVNSNLLLAGELLQYKSFIRGLYNKPSTLSKIVYVSLRNESDSIVFNHKLKIEKGAANGDFFIPANLKTGVYRLIGYTNFSRNNIDDLFAEKNIYIINPFIKEQVNSSLKKADTVFLKNNANLLQKESLNSPIYTLKTNKSSYGFREKVLLNIKNIADSANGNYVLSVRRLNPVEIIDNTAKSKNIELTETFYIPELRGEIISGIVFSVPDNIPVAGEEVSLTVPGTNFIFKISRTNKNGRFFFSISETYSAKQVIVQLNESSENSKNLNLVIDEKDIELNQSELSKIEIDSNLKDWLQERSVQLQIENAYFEKKRDSIIAPKISPTFYGDLGTVFLLDDYTRFSSVRETFIEVVTLAAVRGSGQNAEFIVNNEYDPRGTAKFNDLPPLVLIDGVQVHNNEYLLNYNTKEIKSIRVINKPYRFGSKIFSGIIDVKTNGESFTAIIANNNLMSIKVLPPQKGKIYFQPNYKEEDIFSRIPDFRTQLLWRPNVDLKENSFQTVFYTSDVTGMFEIKLEGFSDEGEYITIKSYFEVLKD